MADALGQVHLGAAASFLGHLHVLLALPQEPILRAVEQQGRWRVLGHVQRRRDLLGQLLVAADGGAGEPQHRVEQHHRVRRR